MNSDSIMFYESVSFNVEVILKFNSCEEFINHRSYQHLWPELSEEKRKERLRELYNLLHENG